MLFVLVTDHTHNMLEKMSWEMKAAGYFSEPEHALRLYLQIDYVTVRVLPADLMKFIYKDSLLRSYLFYDVTHGRESHRCGSVSFQYIHEAHFALQ